MGLLLTHGNERAALAPTDSKGYLWLPRERGSVIEIFRQLTSKAWHFDANPPQASRHGR